MYASINVFRLNTRPSEGYLITSKQIESLVLVRDALSSNEAPCTSERTGIPSTQTRKSENKETASRHTDTNAKAHHHLYTCTCIYATYSNIAEFWHLT